MFYFWIPTYQAQARSQPQKSGGHRWQARGHRIRGGVVGEVLGIRGGGSRRSFRSSRGG